MMCRDVYHCAPRDLPPWHIIRRHIAIMEVEADVRKRRQKAKK